MWFSTYKVAVEGTKNKGANAAYHRPKKFCDPYTFIYKMGPGTH